MSYQGADFKAKVHRKKLKAHKDRMAGVERTEVEKTIKQHLMTEIWDFNHKQMPKSRYSTFREHLNARLQEDPSDAEIIEINKLLEQIKEAVKYDVKNL